MEKSQQSTLSPHSRDLEKQKNTNDGLDSGSSSDNTKDPNVVDWDGPNDPANPLNWSTGKKFASIALISLISFLSPLASTIISPVVADVMDTFNSTDETVAAFVTSVFVLGYASGPVVIAPLSELYGRAILYNVCNTLFVLFNIGCALANNLAALIVLRLLAGIAGSCPMTLGAGSIADMVPLEKRGIAMVFWTLGPTFAPTCGPLIGGYLAQAKGWRWVFWVVSIVAGAVWLLTLVFVRESYAYVILKQKTERLKKKPGNTKLRSVSDVEKSSKALFQFSIVRPIKMLFLSPILFSLSSYMATIYGFFYLLFTTFPTVFEGQYGFSSSSSGLVYLGTGVGSMIGLFATGAISDRLVMALAKRNGSNPKPEYRLPVMVLGGLLVPIGLFWYGWSAEAQVHWMVPIVGTGFVGAGVVLIFMAVSTYLIDAFTVYAASAMAATAVLRSLVGSLLPLAGGRMYGALGVGWGTSLLGFIAVAFVPMPVIFFVFGERIRGSNISRLNL